MLVWPLTIVFSFWLWESKYTLLSTLSDFESFVHPSSPFYSHGHLALSQAIQLFAHHHEQLSFSSSSLPSKFFFSKLVNSKWVVGDRWHCLPVLSSWCQFPPVVTPSVQRLPRASPIRVSVTNQGGRRDPGEGRPLLNPGPRGSVVEKPDHTPKPPWSTYNRF